MTRIKNQVVVILDTDSPQPIQIGKMENNPPQGMMELYNTMNLDMATLCEALVVLVNEAEKMGFKNKGKSLGNIIKHITEGVNDPTNRTSTLVKFGGLN